MPMENLEEAENFWKVIEQADEAFFLYNLTENRPVFVSPALGEILQVPHTTITGNPRSLLDMVEESDVEELKDRLKEVTAKSERGMLDFRINRPNGLQRWIRMKVYPVVGNGGSSYIGGIIEDDSARKNSIFNMQKINGWKNSLLQIMAHDLKSPIGIVNILAERISKKFGDLDEEIVELTRRISVICERNINLIRGVLKRESLDSSEVEISKERLDVVWEINQVMGVFHESQQGIQKQFEFTHSHDAVFAEADSMMFLQIVNNLVSNAIKFTRDGGRIKVHLEKLEKSFVVTVSDNGIGIPKKFHPILFNKYTEAGRLGLKGEASDGLGMWIAKTLTEAHGGKIWFESEENQGSTFYVEIPLI